NGKIYRIVNWKSKTAIDLGEDRKSVTGSEVNGTSNQQWLAEERDSSGMWTLKNVHSGGYLGFKGHAAGLRDGLAVTLVKHAFEWQIVVDDNNESVNRLYVPYTWYNLELYTDDGVLPSGLLVTLGKITRPGEEQTWSFELV
ncbi:hypothetical protein BDQ17DRAFT_1375073, partial [Cyathus striatus]